ncbi:MAG: amidohydrolase family protein [Elusimicrobiota bacterium]
MKINNTNIFDTHIHCDVPGDIRTCVDGLSSSACGVTKFGMLTLGHMKPGSEVMSRVNSNPVVLAAKVLYPDKVYGLGAPDDVEVFDMDEPSAAKALEHQAERIHALGFDGVKLIESKPEYYVSYKHKIGSPVFTPFFKSLETNNLPVLWHVGDPLIYWDLINAPEHLKAKGWVYDNTYPTLEFLWQDALSVVKRHPRVNFVFAHMFFMTHNIPRLSRIFEEYPNFYMDITPGSWVYFDIAKNLDTTREMFVKYSERIVFGSDNALRGGKFSVEKSVNHILHIRRLMESDDRWEAGKYVLHGLNLPEEVLRKIYSSNADKIFGKVPKKISYTAAIEECRRMLTVYPPTPSSSVPDYISQALKLIENR